MTQTRVSGVLLHISSLPGRYGIGDMGDEAYRFVDLLCEAGQRVWQVLPLVPVGHGYSPYSSPSTFASNPLLISPDKLVEEGFLLAEDLAGYPELPEGVVDWESVIAHKTRLLQIAYERFRNGASHERREEVRRYTDAHRDWLFDYALFTTLKGKLGENDWTQWPGEAARRTPDAVWNLTAQYEYDVHSLIFQQYLFDCQWRRLKQYANQRSVQIFGDIPIYVAHDSADVWANQHLFYLDERGCPTVVAGVPPDYFSETGQRWGNPIYRWDRMREDGYAWWERRLRSVLSQVDLVRLDHFRAFEAYWEIPASEHTAINGRWTPGPGADVFAVLFGRMGRLPLIAEDLGLITPGVVELMTQFDFPGMAVLHFAFESGVDNNYLPHNYKRNLVAYTGTHDNDTTLGWLAGARAAGQQHVLEYVRAYTGAPDLSDAALRRGLIHTLMASVAETVILPFQDVLGLGAEGRMNKPGVGTDNWAWRFSWDMVRSEECDRLRRDTETFGRAQNRNPFRP